MIFVRVAQTRKISIKTAIVMNKKAIVSQNEGLGVEGKGNG